MAPVQHPPLTVETVTENMGTGWIKSLTSTTDATSRESHEAWQCILPGNPDLKTTTQILEDSLAPRTLRESPNSGRNVRQETRVKSWPKPHRMVLHHRFYTVRGLQFFPISVSTQGSLLAFGRAFSPRGSGGGSGVPHRGRRIFPGQRFGAGFSFSLWTGF